MDTSITITMCAYLPFPNVDVSDLTNPTASTKRQAIDLQVESAIGYPLLATD